MTPERMAEWVKISHKVAGLFPIGSGRQMGSVITLQQLARFEDDIDKLLDGFRAKRMQSIPDDPLGFDRIVGYSILWVLGAYEIARTLAQTTRDARLTAVRDKFGRLRVPLAKLEASPKHRDTDFTYPSLIVHPRTGNIGWAVAEQEIVTRNELSDSLLEALKYFVNSDAG